MAWFLNYYLCERCDSPWTDEWSCMCDVDCPRCGARHMTPFKSDDHTTIIEFENDVFVVRWSPESAAHDPEYRDLSAFSTRQQAEAFVASG